MRLLWSLALVALCAGCSLVIDGRTEPYEGACANYETELANRYLPDGSLAHGGDLGRAVPLIARECSNCAGDDCVEPCILDDTNDAISFECAACYADAASCAKLVCAEECGGDRPDEVRCERCACNHGCAQELNTCAGLPITTCSTP